MPNGRQNQPRGQQNQGGDQGVTQRLREGAERVGERVREGYDSATEAMARGYRRTEGMIARNPAPSVFMAFGAGLGLGVLMAVALTAREEDSWAERNIPDWLRKLPHSLRQQAEAMAQHIPGR